MCVERGAQTAGDEERGEMRGSCRQVFGSGCKTHVVLEYTLDQRISSLTTCFKHLLTIAYLLKG